jgi:arylformamidase
MTAVWRGMTQEELDKAYNQAAYAPNMAEVIARYARNSDAVRSRIGAPRRFTYGEGEKEGLDVFSPAETGSGAPINVFLHGGAWRSGAARDYAFPAEVFVNAGAHFVVVDFDWVQDHGGDLMPIADQVRRAIAWIARNAATFGGNPDEIHVTGHSSGAHLAGVALTTDWEAGFGLPQRVIRTALLCSGIYDLTPVRLSARSSYVSFTDASVHALSPLFHLDKISVPVSVAFGTKETPEFKRQAIVFEEALARRRQLTGLVVGSDLNHFEILETLVDPRGLLGMAALGGMGIGY